MSQSSNYHAFATSSVSVSMLSDLRQSINGKPDEATLVVANVFSVTAVVAVSFYPERPEDRSNMVMYYYFSVHTTELVIPAI